VRLRTGTDTIGIKAGNTFGAWLRAIRFHYVPPSFLPAILGSLVAWSTGYRINLPDFLLVVFGVTINHCGLNMLDDVCDYLHSVDRLQAGERNPYTGGSGVLTDRLLLPRQLVLAAIFCFSLTTVAGLCLAVTHGWPVLALGLFGIFCSVFYTLPPVKFGYRGLGELGLLVNFGPVIGVGAYYVQAGTVALEPLMVSLVLGVMMWSEIIINEIPDYDEDRVGGKLNLVVRIGQKNAVIVYVAGLVVAYLLLIYNALAGAAPVALLAGLASLPYAVRSIRILAVHYRNRMEMMPANLAMIKAHLLTGLAMIAVYLLQLFVPLR
jgi:1,4-dihydroxy-2-naphthoate polyprenyltransferase